MKGKGWKGHIASHCIMEWNKMCRGRDTVVASFTARISSPGPADSQDCCWKKKCIVRVQTLKTPQSSFTKHLHSNVIRGLGVQHASCHDLNVKQYLNKSFTSMNQQDLNMPWFLSTLRTFDTGIYHVDCPLMVRMDCHVRQYESCIKLLCRCVRTRIEVDKTRQAHSKSPRQSLFQDGITPSMCTFCTSANNLNSAASNNLMVNTGLQKPGTTAVPAPSSVADHERGRPHYAFDVARAYSRRVTRKNVSSNQWAFKSPPSPSPSSPSPPAAEVAAS